MTKAETGILGWATSIRTILASDPAKQAFEEQIHQHGFLYLERYMENILMGPKREPIIELLKTPSRKKAAPKRTRTATAAAAKAQSVISLVTEDQDSEKENLAPVSLFERVLLEAKGDPFGDDDGPEPEPTHFPQQMPASSSHTSNHTSDLLYDEMEIIDVPDSVPTTPAHRKEGVNIHDVDSSPIRPSAEPPIGAPIVSQDHHLTVLQEPAKELSVIAEDDEMGEGSQQSSISDAREAFEAHPALPTPQMPSVDIPESPAAIAIPELDAPTSHRLHTPSTPAASETTQTLHPMTAPPCQDLARSSSGNARSLAPPSAPAEDVMMVPLRDTQSSPKTLNRKVSIPLFPSLPAPSPLRKSMRAPREPSVSTSLHPSINTPAPAGGKRTSWLAKAREAKAIDVPAKRVQTPKQTTQVGAHRTSGGLKRKSDEMLQPQGGALGPISRMEGEDRRAKVARLSEEFGVKTDQDHQAHGTEQSLPQMAAFHEPSEDDLDCLKRTFEESSHIGKSFGDKSLGGPAAAVALAEARKAAEAKVAERNKVQNPEAQSEWADDVAYDAESSPSLDARLMAKSSDTGSNNAQDRLSLSDLGSPGDRKEGAQETSQIISLPVEISTTAPTQGPALVNSDSTTPPNSPPALPNLEQAVPAPADTRKPPVVFVPPPRRSADKESEVKTFSGEPRRLSPGVSSNPFSAPSVFSLAAKLQSLQTDQKAGLTAQSSVASLFSEPVFGSQPAWVPSQETNATESTSRSYHSVRESHDPVFDEEDEAERYEKAFAKANPTWTPFGFANPDESATWTTDPTESHKSDTGPIDEREASVHVAHASDPEDGFDEVRNKPTIADEEDEGDMELDEEDEMLQDDGGTDYALVLPKLSETRRLNESKSNSDKSTARSESQMSVVSSRTSTSQIGFFSHAARFMTNALGSGKKKAEPVKSLQLAAAAAKKQQEEQDRKAARLKEMETRRQQASQRKAEEEKARALEEERKVKDEAERRKREREELTDKRLLKVAGKKVDDDAANKKRKVNADAEKKAEAKKPPSKDKKDPLPTRLPPSSIRPSQSKTNLKAAATPKHPIAGAGPSNYKAPSSGQSKISTLSNNKGKAKTQDENAPDGVRAKTPVRTFGQMQPPKQPRSPAKPSVQSESIELPDIDSEYSDSDDDKRKGNFETPHWAQSPNLRQALEQQSSVNPDHIFGAVRPLHMEEIFRSRQSRFRARTSSANWTGADRLTIEEQLNYARRMGYE
ncbi:hypothetical protein OE88DRAFT_1803681 [Heliocybe sulcata]|uniref:Inner centromere protein ARK-binding domain-containing protein n=1 Tax=Heliocybe sulcata TaxID=5364 RepID=A0A5C3NJJ6_9AGAM|nr:hypothetical protein OE88DRAFT_1803681 [Heliocybe sulcata]